MKKIFAFIILLIALVSCYDDYVKDFTFSSVYFPNPIDVRTVVVGEGLQVKIGVELGGVMDNTMNRNINFTLDNSLVTPALLTSMKSNSNSWIKNPASTVSALLPLPVNYYTLSNNSTIIIKAGDHTGTVTLKVDSAVFLADNATLISTYIIPFYITTADVDTILEPMRSAKVGIKYENMLFGNYLHGGVTTVKDATGNVIQTIPYYTYKSQPDAKIWNLTTTGPNSLASNGYSDQNSSERGLILTLNGTSITVSSATGSTNTFIPDGASTYNAAKLLQDRMIFLNYKYVVGTDTYYCKDTLTFRNRIRDGVNEWQDENPLHY